MGSDGCTLPRLGTSRILEGLNPQRGLVEPESDACPNEYSVQTSGDAHCDLRPKCPTHG